jgi:aryl-alcohol dehydrogenase-like predicted oxidoreductase
VKKGSAVRHRRTPDGLLEVSAVGIGTYAAAGVYGKKDRGTIGDVLRAAYDRGITMFDTAPGYGDAERILGEALGDVRADIVISSKVAAGLDSVSCSPETITRSCEESLRRLGTDRIDIYQIHFDDGVTPVEEVVKAFEALRSQGKIHTYGIGHVSVERAAEYLDKGSPSTVMGELNAVSRNYYLKMLPLLKKSPVGYIGFSLTGRGMLTSARITREDLSPGDIRQIDAVFAGERRCSALRVRDEFGKIGKTIGASAAQLGIAWAIAQCRVLAGLIGPSTIGHLDEDVKGAELELDSAVIEHLDSFLAEERTRLAAGLTKEVASILGGEIKDAREGAPALIYAMEALTELELAADEDLLSKIGSVLKIMKSGRSDLSTLEAIRKDLLDYVETT